MAVLHPLRNNPPVWFIHPGIFLLCPRCWIQRFSALTLCQRTVPVTFPGSLVIPKLSHHCLEAGWKVLSWAFLIGRRRGVLTAGNERMLVRAEEEEGENLPVMMEMETKVWICTGWVQKGIFSQGHLMTSPGDEQPLWLDFVFATATTALPFCRWGCAWLCCTWCLGVAPWIRGWTRWRE